MPRPPLIRTTLAFAAGAFLARAVSRRRGATLVFVGTQGAGLGQGIHAARLDEATGRLSPIGLAAEFDRPTWLLADPSRPWLYAVSELGNDGRSTGEVASYQVDAAGGLRLIGRTGSGGGGPTHLDIDAARKALFVANFGDGRATLVPITAEGALGPVAAAQTCTGSGPHRRQQGPHPHGVTLDPSGRFLLVPDMGADRVFVFGYDAAERSLSPVRQAFALPAGSGPRTLLFNRNGRFAYLLTELSAELFVLRWDPDGGLLSEVMDEPLDPSIPANSRSAAALAFNARRDRLYASDRTARTIVVYAVDAETGHVKRLQAIDSGGAKPWSAQPSPSGRWLLVTNQGADEVRVFRIDRRTGELSPTGFVLPAPSPTSAAFAARTAARMPSTAFTPSIKDISST